MLHPSLTMWCIDEQQHVLLGAQPQQRRAEERARREVERPRAPPRRPGA